MANSSTGKTTEDSAPGKTELVELRRIIVGPEADRLQDLEEQLEDPNTQAEKLSRVLPHAIKLRGREDVELTSALSPVVESIIGESVRRNPKALVGALFPIMGSMVRRAIAGALRGMLESFNRTLDQSLSPTGLRWRLEAWRTGKPFSEVVLLHSLQYRVEQVFLIHRESGLLLSHVTADAVEAQDPALVSAMLTAIEDFVEDSFRVNREEALESLQFGDLTILIEEGPLAVLAAVVRGNAPSSLREDLVRIIEQVHFEYGDHLEALPDDTGLFQSSEPLLRECLQSRLKSDERERKRFSGAFWIAAVLLLILVCVGVLWTVRDRIRWSAFLDRLDAEPGIVVTSADRGWWTHSVSGLRDPLSRDPQTIAQEVGIAVDRVQTRWEPYLTLEPDIVVRRAGQVLQPPEGVSLALDEGVLRMEGNAEVSWILRAREKAGGLAGVDGLDTSRLKDATLSRLRDSLADLEILFSQGSAAIPDAERRTLEAVASQVRGLGEWAKATGNRPRLVIIGATDPTGSERRNAVLAERRALAVRDALVGLGISFQETEVVMLARPASGDLPSAQTPASQRKVSFELSVDNSD